MTKKITTQDRIKLIDDKLNTQESHEALNREGIVLDFTEYLADERFTLIVRKELFSQLRIQICDEPMKYGELLEFCPEGHGGIRYVM